MGTINKEIYMRGCHLVVKITDDSSNIYQFVFNPETKDFSDIYSCSDTVEYELEDDGVYEIVTIKCPSATFDDNGLKIHEHTFTDSEELLTAIESPIWILGTDTEYTIDETLSICKLKKCLVNLQLKAFQEAVKNCGSAKCKNDELKSQRDFVFIAVWLIEHYIEIGNIERALSIYERIKTCGSLCDDLLKSKNNCGCNG